MGWSERVFCQVNGGAVSVLRYKKMWEFVLRKADTIWRISEITELLGSPICLWMRLFSLARLFDVCAILYDSLNQTTSWSAILRMNLKTLIFPIALKVFENPLRVLSVRNQSLAREGPWGFPSCLNDSFYCKYPAATRTHVSNRLKSETLTKEHINGKTNCNLFSNWANKLKR